MSAEESLRSRSYETHQRLKELVTQSEHIIQGIEDNSTCALRKNLEKVQSFISELEALAREARTLEDRTVFSDCIKSCCLLKEYAEYLNFRLGDDPPTIH